jgi:DsbC/DsbD-like thiol-disulfide interchange protein
MKKIFLYIFAAVILSQASAQSEPIKWKYEVKMLSNCEAELVFTATVEKGWHLYSQKHNGLPLEFIFDETKSYTRNGGVAEPEPNKEYDDILQYDVYYFNEQEVRFSQKIKIMATAASKITGKIRGQVCQLETGVCLPLNTEFSFEVPQCP